jgi:hypothetical protein
MFRVGARCVVPAVAAVVASAVLLVTPAAFGQCGAKRSSCSGCHDGSAAPYSRAEAWHEEHAFADVCSVCHGGDPEATSVTVAHAGLVDPLDAPEATCASCHGSASRGLADRYRASRTPRPGERGPHDGAPAPAGGGPTARPERHGESGPNAIMAAVVGAVGLVGGIFVAVRERAFRRPTSHGGALAHGDAS